MLDALDITKLVQQLQVSRSLLNSLFCWEKLLSSRIEVFTPDRKCWCLSPLDKRKKMDAILQLYLENSCVWGLDLWSIVTYFLLWNSKLQKCWMYFIVYKNISWGKTDDLSNDQYFEQEERAAVALNNFLWDMEKGSPAPSVNQTKVLLQHCRLGI